MLVLVDRKRKGLIDYSRNCRLIVGGNKRFGSQDGVVASNGSRGCVVGAVAGRRVLLFLLFVFGLWCGVLIMESFYTVRGVI